MTSKEIAQRISELTAEKEKLEKDLLNAIECENKEREEKQLGNIRDAIKKLSRLYWKDDDYSEVEKRLNNITDIPRLNVWLESDAAAALKKTKLNDLEKIRKIVKESGSTIVFEKCVEDATIRLDFGNALRNVKHGDDLSYPLSWGFDKEDLMNLMRLHKSNKFRRKIEDLLTDCNFHSECGLLSEKKYDEYERLVLEED